MNESIREEPASVPQLSGIVRQLPRVILRGAESKPVLASASPADPVVSLHRLTGVVAYHPLDFSITVRAGTPLAELTSILADRGQCLPFDPPQFSPGATAGGCVSAGLDGPGAFGHHGIRDHVLAVQFCDGSGQVLRSGARVLKNSSGLDLGRFLTGSLGRFAALTEVTFRTRVVPETTASIAWPCTSFDRAVHLLGDLGSSPWAFDALDLEVASPESPIHVVLGRIAGHASTVPSRAQRIVQTSSHPALCLAAEESSARWEHRRHLRWVPHRHALIQVPLPLSSLPAFDAACAALEGVRTYTHGGRLAWVALPAPALLESALHDLNLKGLVVLGPPTFTGAPFLGKWPFSPLLRRLKSVFDPHGKFLPWPEADSS